ADRPVRRALLVKVLPRRPTCTMQRHVRQTNGSQRLPPQPPVAAWRHRDRPADDVADATELGAQLAQCGCDVTQRLHQRDDTRLVRLRGVAHHQPLTLEPLHLLRDSKPRHRVVEVHVLPPQPQRLTLPQPDVPCQQPTGTVQRPRRRGGDLLRLRRRARAVSDDGAASMTFCACVTVSASCASPSARGRVSLAATLSMTRCSCRATSSARRMMENACRLVVPDLPCASIQSSIPCTSWARSAVSLCRPIVGMTYWSR